MITGEYHRHLSGTGAGGCTGFYTRRLSDERIVHNLEHGNIVVSYNLANRDEVTKLRDSRKAYSYLVTKEWLDRMTILKRAR